jgi:hypothetical protein
MTKRSSGVFICTTAALRSPDAATGLHGGDIAEPALENFDMDAEGQNVESVGLAELTPVGRSVWIEEARIPGNNADAMEGADDCFPKAACGW